MRHVRVRGGWRLELPLRRHLVAVAPQDPRDGRDGGRARAVAQPLLDQPVSNLPAEDAGVLLLVLLYARLHLRGGHPWFGAANDARSDRPCLLVSVQDLADTAMAHPELSGDDTGPNSSCCHLDYLEANVVG